MTDEALAKKLYGQLAAGFQWLGQCGVVHKDLKPDNIMLTKPFLQGALSHRGKCRFGRVSVSSLLLQVHKQEQFFNTPSQSVVLNV